MITFKTKQKLYTKYKTILFIKVYYQMYITQRVTVNSKNYTQ